MIWFCIRVLAPLGLYFAFKFRLDSIYTFGDIAVLKLWHFGWKTPIRANFRRFFELLTPKLWRHCCNPKRNATHPETRILTYHSSKSVQPLAALKNKLKIKKAQTINIVPLRGDHAPEPIDMPFSVCHRRNHPCQILCRSVEEFLRGSTPKNAISYTFWNDRYNSSALPCRLWLL